MRIEHLNLVIRPRHPYEAADLGVTLMQHNGVAVYRIWLALMLPLVGLMVWLEHLTGRLLGIGILWWLKPAFDYLALWILSRAVFGVRPTLREALAAFRGFPGAGLFGALTLRRLSLSRAYVLPVRLLEDLKGTARDQRIALIRKNQTGRARWLIQIYMAAEMSVFIGLLSLVVWFAPAFQDLDIVADFLNANAGDWKRDLLVLIYGLSVTLVEPFYVASAFLLYLNRRTDLEAWDIEIAFRQLAQRLQTGGGD